MKSCQNSFTRKLKWKLIPRAGAFKLLNIITHLIPHHPARSTFHYALKKNSLSPIFIIIIESRTKKPMKAKPSSLLKTLLTPCISSCRYQYVWHFCGCTPTTFTPQQTRSCRQFHHSTIHLQQDHSSISLMTNTTTTTSTPINPPLGQPKEQDESRTSPPESGKRNNHSSSTSLPHALREFKSIFGETNVMDDETFIQSEMIDCSGNTRHVPAILYPNSVEQISNIVRVANAFKINLYPVSTGHNWGYGSSNPIEHDCVVVNLSKMTQIEFHDEETGLVTVEPGVTQGLLHEYLVKRNLPFLVPTTGGGPNCSLLGNALERGFGVTPHADHFAAVMSMEVVLPKNGEIYTSMLENMGGSKRVERSFKWGVGPYVDGLFTQSNLGIVTKMTILLAPKPERIETFFFGVSELQVGVEGVKTVLKQLGSNIGAINLMNQRRMMSMAVPYPREKVTTNGILPPQVVDEISRQYNFLKWNGVGTIYGTSKVVSAVKSEIKKYLLKQQHHHHLNHPPIQRLIFLTPKK